MKKEEIHLYDWQRILLGNAPVEFMLEVLIRSAITYVILLIVVRLMGKRMSGELTFTEMAVMLMLGAIVSSAMEIPERGIIEGAFVLFLVFIIQRLVTLWMFRNSKVEDKILNQMYLLVKDGVLQLSGMQKDYIPRAQLYGQLRSKNITNLGAIKRLYMETSGAMTIYKNKNPLPGLSVLPRDDKAIIDCQPAVPDKQACTGCGTVYEASHLPDHCSYCGDKEFEPAVSGT